MSEIINSQLAKESLSRRQLLVGMAALALGAPASHSNTANTAGKLAPIIYNVDTSKKQLAFTFDDGPWPKNTKTIMNHFKSFGLEGQATFFQIGNNIKSFEDITEEAVDRGYEIGNHSMSHIYNPYQIAKEIKPTQDLLADIGVETNLFRSPGLTRGNIIQQKLARLGMVNVFTDYDIGDWKSPRISSKEIQKRTLRSIHKGSIVLLHDAADHQNTVQAIPRILDIVLSRGYQVVKAGDLINKSIN